jgi:hypothetical protein
MVDERVETLIALEEDSSEFIVSGARHDFIYK